MISILLATYNGEEYIIEQLDSLYKQIRKPDEVIIIDDCSTDKTVDVVKKYIAKMNLEDSWKIIVNEKNKGWRQNFRDGIALTTGDIIFFADQDDVWFVEKILIISELFKEQKDINVIGSDKIFFGEDIPVKKDVKQAHTKKVVLKNKAKKLLIQTGGSTMAFRRSYYDSIEGFYSPEFAHDDFFWKMGVVDSSLLVIKEPLIFRRIHANNASMKKRNRSMALDMLDKQVDTATSVYNYLNSSVGNIKNLEKRKKIVNNYICGTKARKRMIASGKIRMLIKVIPFYWDVYFNFRTFMGDVVLTIYPNWRNS